jgi:hypothetical protein
MLSIAVIAEDNIVFIIIQDSLVFVFPEMVYFKVA